MAATLISTLLFILLLLPYNHDLQSLKVSKLLITPTSLQSSYLFHSNWTQLYFKSISTLRLTRLHLPTGFKRSRFALSRWTKHGYMSLVIPGHDPPLDITIFNDIAINPGPYSKEKDLNSCVASSHPTNEQSTKISYSRSQLISLRTSSKQHHISTLTYQTLKDLKFFIFRGKRAGKQKIPVRITRCHFNYYSRPHGIHAPLTPPLYPRLSSNPNNLINIELQPCTVKPLQLCLLNARSINNKSLFIKDYVVENNIDIFAITETWLKPDPESSTSVIRELCPKGFVFLHVPRHSRTGGGVGLLYNKQLKIVKRNTTNTFSSFEFIELMLHSSTTSLLISIIYRPPPSSTNGLTPTMFLSDFSTLLGQYSVSPGKLLILGDFNFHVEDTSDHHATLFLDLLDTFNLKQHVSFPTHKNNHILDLIITRADETTILGCTTHDPVLSDHFMVHCDLSLSKPRLQRTEKVYRKLYSVDTDSFLADLKQSSLITSPTTKLTELCEQYHSDLSSLVNKYAPIRKRLVTSRPKAPWFTEEIATEKSKRRRLERHWRKSMLEIDRRLYADQCQLVRDLIKSTKMKHYSTLIINNQSDPKSLFSIIDRLLHRKPEKLLPLCNSTSDLCNQFADFFVEKISNIRLNLDLSPNPTSNQGPAGPYNLQCELSSLAPTTVQEISSIIKKIALKSCVLDPIPAVLLQCCLNELLPTITTIINLSFETCEIPTSLKQAAISPRLKKPSLDHEELSNFRPVSNLTFLSKAIEKVVATRLTDYLNKNNLHEDLQSAYKVYHSCETALVKVQNDILSSIDQQDCVILLLLDLSSAFDTVDHQILLNRLSSTFGVKGDALKWFTSYLSHRQQFVHINNTSSSIQDLLFGVPQGSILGPILYLLYTAPLGDILRKHNMSYHFYADDTQIYLSFSSNSMEQLTSTKVQIESCIQEINQWMTANKLKLNNNKTEILLFHSRYRPYNHLSSVTIGDNVIQPSSHSRNIGCIFDDTLTMTRQVNQICKSGYYQLRNIAKVRKFLSFQTTEILIHAFVTSKLDNCNSLYYGLPKHLIKKLQHVQNAAARILTCSRKYDHITPILQELHWLPVHKRIIFKILLLTYKSLNDCAPSYLRDLLHIKQPARSLRSSSDTLILARPVPRLKTYGQRAFSVCSPELWNSLPFDIRKSSSIYIFKSKLKSHLFKSD